MRLQWPVYTDEEIAAVGNVLRSGRVNYWTGTECKDFEVEFAKATNSSHAIALSNGTVALDLAFRALDVGPGDEVIVSPRTFMASVSSIVLLGATPIFADVDPDTQNITKETIECCMSSNTKAILLVHLAGWPCEMDSIMSFAKSVGVKVVEDCAQAHGAKYKGKSVGSFGDIAAWSFCQDKIMSTGGEGGMVTTSSKDLWEAMWAFKDHGKSFDTVNQTHKPGFRWLHESFGSNYRMTEMQAVLGRSQLRKLSDWTAERRKNANQILDVCEEFSRFIRVPRPESEVITHAWYKCYVFVRPENLPADWSRDRIIEEISREGVPCYTGTCPEVYLEKAFDNIKHRPPERLRIARELGETSLMFLVHPSMTTSDMNKTVDVIRRTLRKI